MLIPDNAYIIESEYCNRDEYKIVKREQVEKYKDKYPDVKCVLIKSDTRGLRLYVTYSVEIRKKWGC